VVLRNKDGNTSVVKKEENSDVASLLGATFEQASPELLARVGVKNGVQVTRLGMVSCVKPESVKDM
jgi:hypothetical protein